MLPISVVIITKNEALNLPDCIASISFSPEIIVVDSGSTDGTKNLARTLGAHVIEHEWQGYGAQKNVGLDHATNDWVLFLDADERVSSELQEALEQITHDHAHGLYWITIVDTFLGKKLTHLVGHNPRLVKKGDAYWSDAHVHERMVYKHTGTVAAYKDTVSGEIEQPIIHNSHTTVRSYLTKMHRYTSLDAAEMKRTGVHRSGRAISSSWLLPYRLAIRQLVKLLFYRKGILDGWQGVVWCALSAYYEFEMGNKYLAL